MVVARAHPEHTLSERVGRPLPGVFNEVDDGIGRTSLAQKLNHLFQWFFYLCYIGFTQKGTLPISGFSDKCTSIFVCCQVGVLTFQYLQYNQ
jgi:hypothetical protein